MDEDTINVPNRNQSSPAPHLFFFCAIKKFVCHNEMIKEEVYERCVTLSSCVNSQKSTAGC